MGISPKMSPMWLPNQYSRIWAAPLWVYSSQVSALSHKNMELSEFLNIVDRELDVTLDLHTSIVTTVHGHHAATELGGQTHTEN